MKVSMRVDPVWDYQVIRIETKKDWIEGSIPIEHTKGKFPIKFFIKLLIMLFITERNAS